VKGIKGEEEKPGFRFPGSGFRAQGSGLRAQGSGLKNQVAICGLGLEAAQETVGVF